MPLLTREGEVEIAKRIERGKLAVIKSISRTPTVARAIMTMGDQLKNEERSIRELVTFVDEELTDDKIEDRKRQVLRQIEAVRKSWMGLEKCKEKLEKTPRGTTTRDKRKYRRVRWEALRARVELSQLIRKIEFTEAVKRRLIDQIKESVEAVMRVRREIDQLERQLNPKNKKTSRLKEEEKKNLLRRQKELKVQVKTMADELEETPDQLMRTIETISRGEIQAEQGKKELVEANLRPGRLDRQELHEPRPAVPRPDPGRQHRPDEGGRQVRVSPRLQVLDLRDLVDPPGHHPRDCGPGGRSASWST